MFAFGTMLVLYLALFTTCSDGQEKLSDDFDQDKIQEVTTKVIDAASTKDSNALREIGDGTMKSALTDDALAAVHKTIDEGDTFQEIKEVNITGAPGKNTKEDYAVVVTRAQYERKASIYTISFTKNMELAGLRYKQSDL